MAKWHDFFPQVLGKVITGTMVVEQDDRNQVFLFFSDNTHYEFYGSVSGSKGVYQGGSAQIRNSSKGATIAVDRSLPPPLPKDAEAAARKPLQKSESNPPPCPEAFRLDLGRLRKVLDLQLTAYIREFRSDGDSDQDNRAWFIEIMAMLLPEVFTADQTAKMEQLVGEVHRLKDYRVAYWFEILPMECALSVLTHDPHHLNQLIANWDHHNSSLRSHVHKAAALMGRNLGLVDELGNRMLKSLSSHHFYTTYALGVLAGCRSGEDRKREWFGQFLEKAGSKDEIDFIDKLLKHHYVANELAWFTLDMLKYALWLLTCDMQPPVQTRLFEQGSNASRKTNTRREEKLSALLWQRIQEHPNLKLSLSLG